MKFLPTFIPGCLKIVYDARSDDRGHFIKTVQSSLFTAQGLENDFREQFYSVSRRGVVRGMHFQLPPYDHAKLIHCMQGTILDVIVDLRMGSPAFGLSLAVELTEDEPAAFHIPRGCAHGFCALSESATTHYAVTSEYRAESDVGVHWQSLGIIWPVSEREAIVSPRDAMLPPLPDFHSPFRFVPEIPPQR